jgi:DNA-binding LytR/AlgR family response regulator
MEEQEDTAAEIPTSGNDVRRFLPFADSETGRLNWPLPPPERIELKTEKGWLYFETKKILTITAESQYQWIHFVNCDNDPKPEKRMVREGMKYFDEWLFAFGFIRIHNGTIVNIGLLKRREGNQLHLTHTTEAELMVSKGFEPLLEKALSIYRKP